MLVGGILVSRRIPVREWKGSLKKWRTRPVDHGSEGGLEAATEATERMQVQGLEFLVALLLMFMNAGLQALMWKRGLKSAFRNIRLMHEHAWCSWGAWKEEASCTWLANWLHLLDGYPAVSRFTAWAISYCR